MAHTIRTNPDHSQFQVALESDLVSDVCSASDETTILQDDDGTLYLASFIGDELLDHETLYRLTPVSTLVEEVDDFDEEDDGGDDEEETAAAPEE